MKYQETLSYVGQFALRSPILRPVLITGEETVFTLPGGEIGVVDTWQDTPDRYTLWFKTHTGRSQTPQGRRQPLHKLQVTKALKVVSSVYNQWYVDSDSSFALFLNLTSVIKSIRYQIEVRLYSWAERKQPYCFYRWFDKSDGELFAFPFAVLTGQMDERIFFDWAQDRWPEVHRWVQEYPEVLKTLKS